ncbi:tail fiber domain-containing protein [Sphingobium yanoikuyae]|uniref:tail fiber domain-containing protein n=1 Tax=Sphingobium yanoikuyae TaxID=13690 RepID=UPI00242BE122|nr:tail fiber domain-containing protein [Sphingobium yanoikuyae]
MAWYSAGTVTATNGSKTITGAGTDFVSNVLAGHGFVGPDGRTYEIEQVVSATQMLLRRTYLGATAGGQAYDVIPTQGPTQILVESVGDLLATFGSVRDGVGQGLFPDGTVAAPAIRFGADQDTGFYRSASNEIAAACGGATALRFGALGMDLPGSVATGLGLSTGDAAMRVGRNRSGEGPAFVDLHARSGAGFDGRMIRYGGENGTMGFLNLGAGPMEFTLAPGGLFNWYGGTGGANLWLALSGTFLAPGSDNVMALGGPLNRFTAVYSATGAINTSDEREKTWRGGLTKQELSAARRIASEIGAYQWNDAVAEKGEDGARVHYGVRAQQVARILMEEGVEDQQNVDFAPDIFLSEATRPSFKSAFLCFDTWDNSFETKVDRTQSSILDADGAPIVVETPRIEQVQSAGNRFGLRIDQLTMFIIAAQGQRLAALEAA